MRPTSASSSRGHLESKRGRFRRQRRNRGCLGSHTDPKQQTTDEELFPGFAETRADDWEETEYGAEEDGTATPEVKVERVGKPATTTEKTSTRESLGDKLGGTYHKEAAF